MLASCWEVPMGSLRRELFMSLWLIGFSSCALAEDGKRDVGAANAASPDTIRPGLTGKERLGPKWTDEQRIDNCKVPVDKRGPRPPPSACANPPPKLTGSGQTASEGTPPCCPLWMADGTTP
jgi:hypothetical protein